MPTSPRRSSGTPITAACAIARVAQQEVLDLGRVGVEAADDEHVLDAPDDAQVAVGVERAEVAGVQPAVGVDRGRGRLGVVEVAAHHGLAAHDDLARLAGRGVGARRRRPCGPRSPATARRRSSAMCSKSSSGWLPGDGARFGEPVPGEDALERQLLADAPDELDRDVGRAGHRERAGSRCRDAARSGWSSSDW